MACKTQVKANPPVTDVNLEQQCIHHWLIEPPVELISKGICLKCGVERDFDNHVFACSRQQMRDLGKRETSKT
jgi:hypothetical protein